MVETILLLSGPLAVGKTCVRDRLVAAHGYTNIRSSDYLRELAAKDDGASDRLGLQELGDRLDRETDHKWLLDDVAKPLIASRPDVTRWLVDAVRKRRQVEHFRCAFGVAVMHVHLEAEEDVLRQRYESRADKTGSTGNYAEAIDHDNEKQARGLKQLADCVISTDLHSPDEVVEKVLKALTRA
jgi:predicted kinase